LAVILTCPKCNNYVNRGGFAVWQIVFSILFFPLGLLTLLAGRKPTRCRDCGHIWQA
jgi:hypothetical protein